MTSLRTLGTETLIALMEHEGSANVDLSFLLYGGYEMLPEKPNTAIPASQNKRPRPK